MRLGFGLLVLAAVVGVGLGIGSVGAPVLLAGSLGVNAVLVTENGKLLTNKAGLESRLANLSKDHNAEMAAVKRDYERRLNIEQAKVDSLTRQARQVTARVIQLQERVSAIQARAGVGSARRASVNAGGANLELTEPDQVFEALDDILNKEESKLRRAVGPLEAALRREAAIPGGWPARGPVTSSFGYRFGPRTGRLEKHTGWDIAAGFGSRVTATAPGTVVAAGWTTLGYGLHVVIDHGYGYRTLYGHLSRLYVGTGERVTPGELIGAVGSTGNSTGPHLHYEVRVGNTPINPGPYLNRSRPRYYTLEER